MLSSTRHFKGTGARANNPDTGKPLVRDEEFEPSQQQLLQSRLNKMTRQDLDDYRLLTENPPRFVREDGSVIDSSDALDAALTFWEIKNLATETSALAKQKDAVLKASLALPPKPKIRADVHPRATERVKQSQPISQFGVGVQYSQLGQTEYTLRVAPYEQSNQTLHALGAGKELAVLNGQLRVGGQSISLDFLEVIRVSSVSQADDSGLSPLGGRLAWGFHSGSKVLDTDPDYLKRRDAGGLAGQDFYGDLKLGLSKTSPAGSLLVGVYGGVQASTGQHIMVPRLELAGQYRLGSQLVVGATVEYKNAYESTGLNTRDRRVFLKNHWSWALNRDDRLMLGLWQSSLDTGLNFSINIKY